MSAAWKPETRREPDSWTFASASGRTRCYAQSTRTETFEITVTDVNEGPEDIALDAAPIAENAAGAVVGTLSIVDIAMEQLLKLIDDEKQLGPLRQARVEVGQRVAPGTNLARVAEPDRLKAEVRVPETQARDVMIGQSASIDTRNGVIAGRVTRIDPGHFYEFEVAEQALAVGGTMRLSGGQYILTEIAPGETEVAVETRYTSTKWPRWFWRPLERFVCHWFHLDSSP